MIKLHLMCGPEMYGDGWMNVDVTDSYPKKGQQFTKHDLRHGLPPYCTPDSVDFIFSQHGHEHLTRADGVALLKHCYVALKPGGAMRCSVPCLDACIDRYQRNELPPKGVGGWEPSSRCVMINEDFRAWSHQFLYNREELELVFREAGFKNISFKKKGESDFPELTGIDFRRDDDLIVEAVK